MSCSFSSICSTPSSCTFISFTVPSSSLCFSPSSPSISSLSPGCTTERERCHRQLCQISLLQVYTLCTALLSSMLCLPLLCCLVGGQSTHMRYQVAMTLEDWTLTSTAAETITKPLSHTVAKWLINQNTCSVCILSPCNFILCKYLFLFCLFSMYVASWSR